MTPQEILDLPMQPNEAGVSTIRGYLIALLHALWQGKDGFSGKRPFGNSGWEHEVYLALVRAKVVQGVFDDMGFLRHVDYRAADKVIADTIVAMGQERL